MIKISTMLLLLAMLFNPNLKAAAGESGFIYQGKKYVVYKNGKKIGKTFQESFSQEPIKNDRAPSAAIPDSTTYFLSYEADGTTKCYRWSSLGPANSNIFCVN